MGKLAKELRRKRQQELLKLFQQEKDHYEEKQLADKVYVKSFNGNTKRWQVAEYSKASFKKYQQFNETRRINQELDEQFFRAIQ